MVIHTNKFWDQKLGLSKQLIFRDKNATDFSAASPVRMLPQSILNRVPANQHTPGMPVLSKRNSKFGRVYIPGKKYRALSLYFFVKSIINLYIKEMI